MCEGGTDDETGVTPEVDEQVEVELMEDIEIEIENQHEVAEYGETESMMRRRHSTATSNPTEVLTTESGVVLRDGGADIEINDSLSDLNLKVEGEGEDPDVNDGAVCSASDASVGAEEVRMLREYQDDSSFVDRYRGLECQALNIGLFQTYCGAAQAAMQRYV
jgi:hypothetical protein